MREFTERAILDEELDARRRELASLESAIAARRRELDEIDRELELCHDELARLESAVRGREPDPEPPVLTNDLLAARDLVADLLSRDGDARETRQAVRLVAETLTRALEDDRVWSRLDRIADRAGALTPRQRRQLQLAAGADWTALFGALGRSSSLDALTLNRDVAIAVGAPAGGERLAGAGAARRLLRGLTGELTGVTGTRTSDAARLRQLGPAAVFVLTRLRLLFGLTGPGAATAREALVAGALLHGIERAIDPPASGDACWHRAVQALSGRAFADLAARWDELAAAADDRPCPEVIEPTLLLVDEQVANLYLAYEATIAAPAADAAMQASCDALLAVLREAREHLRPGAYDARRVSLLLRRCGDRASSLAAAAAPPAA